MEKRYQIIIKDLETGKERVNAKTNLIFSIIEEEELEFKCVQLTHTSKASVVGACEALTDLGNKVLISLMLEEEKWE